MSRKHFQQKAFQRAAHGSIPGINTDKEYDTYGIGCDLRTDLFEELKPEGELFHPLWQMNGFSETAGEVH